MSEPIITKDDLDKSLADLEFLQKSFEASEKGELLSKSVEDLPEVPAVDNVELSKAQCAPSANNLSKSSDEDEEEEAEEEDKERDEEEEAEKSLSGESDLVKSFEEDGNLKKAIDVSDFLKSLVGKTTDSIGAMDDRLEKSFGKIFELSTMQNAVIKSLALQVDGLSKSLGELRGVPAGMPRSAGVSPVHRGAGDLNKSQGSQPDPQFLRKSILSKMGTAVQKGELDAMSLIKFETTGEISAEDQARFLETK